MTKFYHIVVYVGNAMSGKTTAMFREVERELDLGTTYTHAYSVTHSTDKRIEFIRFEELKDLRCDNKNGKPTALLLIDQLHKFMDSRQSGSPRNKYMGDVLIESRQHGFSTRGTTWARSSIDLRARRFTEMLVQCTRVVRGFEYQYADYEAGLLTKPKLLRWRDAESYWKFFDTTELVEDIDPGWDPRFSERPQSMIQAR